MNLGLDPKDLKSDAMGLHKKWEVFRKTLPSVGSSEELERAAVRAVDLTLQLRDFQTHVYDTQVGGQWVGWLFPSFIDHTRREGDFFLRLLNGEVAELGLASELCNWIRFMREHAQFAAHLLDPSEAPLIMEAHAQAADLGSLEEGCSSIGPAFMELTKRAGEALDGYFSALDVGPGGVQSVIHPALAKHVVREGRMFLELLGHLEGRSNVVEIPE